jgi:hypothetical protein
MLPTILRATILCVSSLIPENSPLDSVVFRSSVQIILSVFYLMLFYMVSIVIRVLISRKALENPTDVGHSDIEHDPNTEWFDTKHTIKENDVVLFDDDGDGIDFMSYAQHSQLRSGVPIDSITGNKQIPLQGKFGTRGGIAILKRVGRKVGRKVRQMASVVVVEPADLPQRETLCVPRREPSVDDPSSGMSDSSEDDRDSGAGVRHVRVQRGVSGTTRGRKQNVGHKVVDAQGSQKSHVAPFRTLQDEPFVDRLTLSDLPDDHKTTLSSVASHPLKPVSHGVPIEADGLPVVKPHVQDGWSHVNHSDATQFSFVSDDMQTDSFALIHDSSAFGMDDIYTDVYGLGFAAYVLHYTIDCASMQPTGFLLIGLTVLSGRDVALISDSIRIEDDSIPQTTLFTRALTVFAFILLVVAQICMVVGIARVPTYYTDARDGGITMIPAPQSILEHLLARVFPLLTPLLIFFVSRKRSQQRKHIPSISKVFRRAMPITFCIALWFITCFGVMSDRVRNAVGALSVNATVTELSETDVTINMHFSMMIFSPFVKTPALISVISCCLSRKTMDVASTLAVVFYAKQFHAVRDLEMLQMLSVSLMCSSVAWVFCIVRYCRPLVRVVASFFEHHNGVYTVEQ